MRSAPRLALTFALAITCAVAGTARAGEGLPDPAPPKLEEKVVVTATALGSAADLQAFMDEAYGSKWDLSRAAKVENLVIRRDVAEMTLTGYAYRRQPVRGLLQAVAFVGEGRFKLRPPIAMERQQVRRFLGTEEVDVIANVAEFELGDAQSAAWFEGLDYSETHAAEARALAESTRAGRKWIEDVDRWNQGKTGEEDVDRRLQARYTEARRAYERLLAPQALHRVGISMTLLVPEGTDVSRSHLTHLYLGHFPLNLEEEVFLSGGFNHGKLDKESWSGITAFHQGDEHRGPLEDFATSDFIEAHDRARVRMNHVDLDLRFEPEKTDDVRMTVVMDLEATADDVRILNFYMTPRLHVLRAFVGGAELAHVQPKIPGTSFYSGVASLPLPKVLGRGERVQVKLELEGAILRSYDGTTFIIQEEDAWFPGPEAGGRAAVFDTTLDVPKGFTAAASGTPTPCEDGAAAEGRECFRFVTNVPVRLVTFNLGRDMRVTRGEAPSGIPVAVYTLKDPTFDPQAVLDKARATLAVYEDWFGPFPYADLKLTPHPKGHGRGFASLLLLWDVALIKEGTLHQVMGRYVGGKAWSMDDFIAHEIAHQWWGGTVFWHSSRDQWFSEGFANYSAVLVHEARDRVLGSQWARGVLDTWYEALTEDDGYIHTRAPLSLGNRYASAENRERYEWARQTFMYEKGAFVMHMLRSVARALKKDQVAGDALFKKAWRAYLEQHRGGAPSTLDMQRSLEASYGMKLDWFFKQWVHGTGIPKVAFTHEVAEAPGGGAVLRGRFVQEGRPFVFPIAVFLRFGKGKQAQESHFHVWVRSGEESFEVPLPARPTEVTVNDDLGVLAILK